MAKYPLIYGNTNPMFDITDSNGVSLSADDSSFDVYTYTNAAPGNNTQRSTAVFIVRNDAIANSGTSLNFSQIRLTEGNSDSNDYEGTNISINPKSGGSTVPFIGSQHNYNTGGDNVVESPGLETLGIDSGAEASTAIGWLKISNDTGTIENEDLGVGVSYRVVPLYDVSDLVTDDIPDNSYAAFLVAFHPTENFTAASEIEAKLKVSSASGIKLYPLKVNSYNEVLMAVKALKDPAGAGHYEDFTHNFYSYDNALINIGNVGTAKTAAHLYDLLSVHALEVLDISPNNNVGGLYTWVDSNVEATDSVTKDDVVLSKSPSQSVGSTNHWDTISTYYNQDGDVILSGNEGSATEGEGRLSLVQWLYPGNSLITGSHTAGTNKLAYASGDKTNRVLMLSAKYLTSTYNNTNTSNESFPDDGDGFNNQWISYGIAYEVYNRVTFSSVDESLTVMKNKLTENVVDDYKHPQLGCSSGSLATVGENFEFFLSTRWTNETGGTESGIGGEDDRHKESINSFSFDVNNSNFKLNSEQYCADVTPNSFVTNAGESVSAGLFDMFSGGTNTTSLGYKFYFNLIASDIYSITNADGLNNVSLSPANEPIFGQYKASLSLNEDDEVWNFSTDAIYPGCDREAALSQRFEALFYARSSYLKILSFSDSLQVEDTGLSNVAATDFTWVNTSWYDEAGASVSNTSSVWDTNNLYSGNGGASFTGSTTTGYEISFENTINLSQGKTYNDNKRYIVDRDGSYIKEFKPLNSLISVNTPYYHSSDDAYVSYFKFKFLSEGDDSIYIHKISFDDDGTDQLLDFDVTAAGNNLYGTPVHGYKPGYNAGNAAATSNDPELTFNVEKVMDDNEYSASKFFLPTGGPGGTAVLTAGNMNKAYRANGGRSFYVPAKCLQYLGSAVTEAQANTIDALQTESSINPHELALYGYEGGATMNPDYIFERPNSEDEVPWGNPEITVKMKVDAKGTLIDFGNYYATMKIVYYRNDVANRNASSWDNTNEYAQPNIRLQEMKVIVKMNVAPAPILAVTDNENVEYFNGSTINMGNLNLG